ncbi:FKBP-type peptidyl-prolyl cis-trans isomerase [Frondihabitans sucicola]|nr:FKBP-type peptidyl-prolyl cis-trans isomerase [Frondihabitans sucicola]
MKITKTLAIAATVGALVSLGLAGCSASTDSSASCGTKSGSVSDSIKATGKVGSAPKVSFEKKLSTKTTEKSTLVKGKGAAIKSGQPVIFQVSLYDGATGKKATATDYTSSGTYLVAGKSDSLNALSEGLVCSHVGDRIAIAGSAKDSTGGQGISQYKIGAKDSVVFVADVLKAFPSRATGAKQAPVAGVSTVKLAKDGAPTITVSKAKAPTTTQATTLIKGTGAKIAKGDSIMVQYTGVVYATGKVFDSSWAKKQPFVATLTTSAIIPGWVNGLAGKTVGSQVLLTIPPADGYGTKAQTGIPANSTLVFAIDILGKVS